MIVPINDPRISHAVATVMGKIMTHSMSGIFHENRNRPNVAVEFENMTGLKIITPYVIIFENEAEMTAFVLKWQ